MCSTHVTVFCGCCWATCASVRNAVIDCYAVDTVLPTATNEIRFRSLFDNSPDLVLYQNEAGTILDANPAFALRLACQPGRQRAPALGRTENPTGGARPGGGRAHEMARDITEKTTA